MTRFLARSVAPSAGIPLLLVFLACAGCGGLGRSDNARGVALYQQGNYRDAASSFQQALARQPGNPDCFYNLGATYHQQAKLFGRPADQQVAEQYYHLCLQRNPDHEACRRALAVLLVEENRRADAVAQLQAWAQRQPFDPDPHVELARLSQEQGDLATAERELRAALAVAPNDARALVALGSLREAAGDQGQALASYARALAVNPGQPVVAAKVAALQTSPAARTAAAPAGFTPAAGAPPAALPVAPGSFGTVAR